MSLAIKFNITFLDKDNQEQTVDVWSDSSEKKEIIETFEQDYGDDYKKITNIEKEVIFLTE